MTEHICYDPQDDRWERHYEDVCDREDEIIEALIRGLTKGDPDLVQVAARLVWWAWAQTSGWSATLPSNTEREAYHLVKGLIGGIVDYEDDLRRNPEPD